MKKDTADKVLREVEEGYNAISEEFASTRERLYWEELRRFVDYVREGEAVLDVGCGSGRACQIFRDKKIQYAGVDVSGRMIEKARQVCSGPDLHFAVGDVLALPVPDGRYDAVLAVAVLHHIPSFEYRLAAMKELARAARPGGYVMMTTWNLRQPRYWKVWLHQLFGWKNGWDFGDLKISWKKPLFARYYHAFSFGELRRLAVQAGLEIVEEYYVKHGEITNWLRGENLVMIARKPGPPEGVREAQEAAAEEPAEETEEDEEGAA